MAQNACLKEKFHSAQNDCISVETRQLYLFNTACIGAHTPDPSDISSAVMNVQCCLMFILLSFVQFEVFSVFLTGYFKNHKY